MNIIKSVFPNLFKKTKYKITFYRLSKPNWYMICTRSYYNCFRMGLYHFLKGHGIFTITKHSYENFTFKIK